MAKQLIKPTAENLSRYAVEPLTRWMILAAKNRETITYGEAKRRLESEHGFSTIFSVEMGRPAGDAINRILEVDEDVPLLNVLLVRKSGVPGRGAGGYLADYFNDKRLAHREAPTKWPDLWRRYFERAASDAYAFKNWDRIYKKVFKREFSPSAQSEERRKSTQGRERDGLPHGRFGEGENHKALRKWVTNHPNRVVPKLTNVRAKTEVVLLSGDRVDSIYYSQNRTVAVEVKSKDSNEADLQRGIYQCIKYRAVLAAADPRLSPPVDTILVTEAELPGDLAALAGRLKIKHFLMPPNWRK